MTSFDRKLIQIEERGALPVESVHPGVLYVVDPKRREVYIRAKRGNRVTETILTAEAVRELAEAMEVLC